MSTDTLSPTQYNQWKTVFDDLRSVLNKASEERAQRRDFVETTDAWGRRKTEPAWFIFERDAMHDAVNKHRARAGMGLVDVVPILLAESRACGHIDYVAKYALGCADVATKREPHSHA